MEFNPNFNYGLRSALPVCWFSSASITSFALTPYLQNTIAVDKQVARFDVSMKNASRMEILETYRQKQYFVLLL
jgi:hypothetical protein